MAKLLINDQNKVLVGSNGKAYAVGNIDALKGSSSPVNITAAAGKVLKLMRYGKCEQDGTPTPSAPVDIVCNNGAIVARHESGLPTGVTLLDFVYNSSNTRVYTGFSADVDDIDMEIRVKPSTNSWYIFQSRGSTMFGISGANSGSKIQATVGGLVLVSDITRDTTHIYTVRFTARNGNATLYVKDETGNTEDTKTDTYTFPTGGYTDGICIWGNTSGNTVSANNYVYYAKMWKNGALVLDYVPATKGVENGFYDHASKAFIPKTTTTGAINAGDPVSDPVGVYADGTPEVLSVGGKNLFDNVMEFGNLDNTGGTNGQSQHYLRSVNFTAVRPDTKYTLMCNNGNGASQMYYLCYAQDGTVLNRTSINKGLTGGVTITTPASASKMKVFIYNDTEWDGVFNPQIQLEEGPTATAYEPYVAPQNVSVENLLSAGDYKDEQDIISGKVTRKCGVCIYDGTQTIGDVFLSTTGGKDNGAIIIYPLATETTEQVTPQPLNTGAGQNILTDTAEVSNPEYNMIYKV